MPTVKDVAELAGVSTATVSRVLNNSPKVSDDTRAKVAWAMEQLDYRPNRIARNLRKQSTQAIGVIIPDIQNHFFVSGRARHRGCRLRQPSRPPALQHRRLAAAREGIRRCPAV
ncbi:MAG: LacI family transcriptional regulator [Anaerolineae bacterium]|nr:LacI family transcriptional regulator [Anaerolineae bacterium]